MKETQLRESFLKIKQDIGFLADEIYQLKQEIIEIKQILDDFQTSTLRHINSTHPATSTQTSTLPQEIGGLRSPNLSISTGNQGASTDRQTDTSTDTSTHNSTENPPKSIETNIQEASEILESLDNLKKEIRMKFKRVTPQEMAVFSTIYQLEEQNPNLSNYKQISKKLGLSESSIRDYVQRMINKGISIKKQKIGNKKLILSISSELKKIATLSTIIQLRDL
jgi:DNA-binding MarR family transcriptional regulator